MRTLEILMSWNIDPESDDPGTSLASLIAVLISHGCHMKSLEYINLSDPWLFTNHEAKNGIREHQRLIAEVCQPD